MDKCTCFLFSLTFFIHVLSADTHQLEAKGAILQSNLPSAFQHHFNALGKISGQEVELEFHLDQAQAFEFPLFIWNDLPFVFDYRGLKIYVEEMKLEKPSTLLRQLSFINNFVHHHKFLAYEGTPSLEESWSSFGMGFCGQISTAFFDSLQHMGIDMRPSNVLDGTHYLTEIKLETGWALADFDLRMLAWDGNQFRDWNACFRDPLLAAQNYLGASSKPSLHHQYYALLLQYNRPKRRFTHHGPIQATEAKRAQTFKMLGNSTISFSNRPADIFLLLNKLAASPEDCKHLREGTYSLAIEPKQNPQSIISPLVVHQVVFEAETPLNIEALKKEFIKLNPGLSDIGSSEKVLKFKSLSVLKEVNIPSIFPKGQLKIHFIYNQRFFEQRKENFSISIPGAPPHLKTSLKIKGKTQSINNSKVPNVVIDKTRWHLTWKDAKPRSLFVHPKGKIMQTLPKDIMHSSDKSVYVSSYFSQGPLELSIIEYQNGVQQKVSRIDLPEINQSSYRIDEPLEKLLKDSNLNIRVSKHKMFPQDLLHSLITPPHNPDIAYYSHKPNDTLKWTHKEPIPERYQYLKFYQNGFPVSPSIYIQKVFDANAPLPTTHQAVIWTAGQKNNVVGERLDEIQWLEQRSTKQWFLQNLSHAWRRYKNHIYYTALFVSLFIIYRYTVRKYKFSIQKR